MTHILIDKQDVAALILELAHAALHEPTIPHGDRYRGNWKHVDITSPDTSEVRYELTIRIDGVGGIVTVTCELEMVEGELHHAVCTVYVNDRLTRGSWQFEYHPALSVAS